MYNDPVMNEINHIAELIGDEVGSRQENKFTGKLRISVDFVFGQGGIRDIELEVGPTVRKIRVGK